MSPTDAAALAKRGRRLLRAGKLSHRQLALLDCLLWSCRRPGTRFARVSYGGLQRLARLSRETIAAGLRALERLGLLTRHPQRDGAGHVAVSVYELHTAAPEFGQRTAISVQVSQEASNEARAALAVQLAASERRFLAAWQARRSDRAPA